MMFEVSYIPAESLFLTAVLRLAPKKARDAPSGILNLCNGPFRKLRIGAPNEVKRSSEGAPSGAGWATCETWNRRTDSTFHRAMFALPMWSSRNPTGGQRQSNG